MVFMSGVLVRRKEKVEGWWCYAWWEEKIKPQATMGPNNVFPNGMAFPPMAFPYSFQHTKGSSGSLQNDAQTNLVGTTVVLKLIPWTLTLKICAATDLLCEVKSFLVPASLLPCQLFSCYVGCSHHRDKVFLTTFTLYTALWRPCFGWCFVSL